jgi:protein TonB
MNDALPKRLACDAPATINGERTMLDTLMESRANRQRRAGGAALSVAVHVAIIGAVTVTAVHGTTPPKPKPVVPVTLSYAPPIAHTPVLRASSGSAPPSRFSMPIAPQLPRIAAPTITPTSLPSIDATRGFSPDSISASDVHATGSGVARGLSLRDGDGVDANDTWRGNEILMHVLRSARPRYPESLRQAAVDGQVLVRFTVDTTGRIDMSSVQFLRSTHELFSRSVRDALVNFRFKPAEVGGRKVSALAEMPFEFAIQR